MAIGCVSGFYLGRFMSKSSESGESGESGESDKRTKPHQAPQEPLQSSSVHLIVKAVAYSTEKHKDQRRKNSEQHPYICHPVRVANLLLNDGGIRDASVLAAAFLHDTVEDTNATLEEIQTIFGTEVALLVKEVSDDKSLPKDVRKQLQIRHAPNLSSKAKTIKLADKLDNLSELLHLTPQGWSPERVGNYFEWAAAVVDGLRGSNPALEKNLDRVLQRRDTAVEKAATSSSD